MRHRSTPPLPDYGSVEYWDNRYIEAGNQASFEWFFPYKDVQGPLESYLRPDKSLERVLVLGCGTSALGADLRKSGFHHITCVDFSGAAIRTGSYATRVPYIIETSTAVAPDPLPDRLRVAHAVRRYGLKVCLAQAGMTHTHELWCAHFNSSGVLTFLGDVYNTRLATPLDLFALAVQKDYAGPITLMDVSPSYSQHILLDNVLLEGAVAAMRAGSFETNLLA
ncbi:hypothetical protein B5M09_012848 [Aphanomyces astaci]|uniref:Methyltransferase type 11 domain-containing protein n=1 Tax=Aphanomyces astaci TaxID=112090 RepID=A0A3R7YJE2_APHAT|nr:hypothetical protein B5M09_012848 [Aphanomyces astaci]